MDDRIGTGFVGWCGNGQMLCAGRFLCGGSEFFLAATRFAGCLRGSGFRQADGGRGAGCGLNHSGGSDPCCPRVPHAGQHSPHQQAHCMGVGAQVEPVGVGLLGHALPHGQQRHPARAAPGQHGGHHQHGPPPTQAGCRQQQQGPGQVELLLDGQRPQVLQQRRTAKHLEVRLLRVNLPPVGHIQQRRRQVLLLPPQRIGCPPQRGQGGDHQHGQHGGQQPAQAPGIERAQAQAASGQPLAQQQRGDQKPRQHKKHIHAEKPAGGQPRHLGMKNHDRSHRQRTHAVQPRYVLSLVHSTHTCSHSIRSPSTKGSTIWAQGDSQAPHQQQTVVFEGRLIRVNRDGGTCAADTLA